MRKQHYSILWMITGLVAIGLIIATIVVVYQEFTLPQVVYKAKLTSPNASIYLRAEPSANSSIVTILKRESKVYVIDTVTRQDGRWMKIEFRHYSGWVPDNYLVFESP